MPAENGVSFIVERHPEKIWNSLTEVAVEARQNLRNFYKVKASYSFAPEKSWPCVVLVAKNTAGKPVAAATAENHGTHLYFYKLSVREKFRRQGLARLLTQACQQLAREWNLPKIQIKTIEVTGNVEVFSQLGFVEKDRYLSQIFDSPGGLPVFEVLMELEVS